MRGRVAERSATHFSRVNVGEALTSRIRNGYFLSDNDSASCLPMKAIMKQQTWTVFIMRKLDFFSCEEFDTQGISDSINNM